MSAATIEVDYQTVIITSANKDLEPYNLYEEVKNLTWFGFRTLNQCSLGKFGGFGNKLLFNTLNEDVSSACVAFGLRGGTFEAFRPEVIKTFFGYDFPADIQFPAAYCRLPFEMRDAPHDVLVTDPLPATRPPSPLQDEAATHKRSRREYEDENEVHLAACFSVIISHQCSYDT